ncbi:MAG: gluconate 5-dehydrogenase [Myxococcales bacterium]|nr:gluconate 5-dehydrogenase [Myxococcales bacterium]|tara:strand:- start:101 stop:886 length:786 start_codon:yes stop_codon:yes gene_type:complete
METTPLINLSSKVVLITGGYGHLGHEIVNGLLRHDATVYVLARTEDKFNKAFSSVDKSKLFFRHCDISSDQSIKDSIDGIHAETGRIDSFINNAFFIQGQSPENMSDDDFNHGLDGTLTSTFRTIKSLIPIMKKQGYGKIINVSSMYGMVAPDFSVYDNAPESLNPPHYGAAKAGVIQLTKYYAAYLGQHNINVNVVTPGAFPSQAVQANTAFTEALKKKTALNRIGHPAELGGIFVFLSSDAANYITGQNFVIDGGWTIV